MASKYKGAINEKSVSVNASKTWRKRNKNRINKDCVCQFGWIHNHLLFPHLVGSFPKHSFVLARRSNGPRVQRSGGGPRPGDC
eukprot:2682955-Amphidinium_carterae.1